MVGRLSRGKEDAGNVILHMFKLTANKRFFMNFSVEFVKKSKFIYVEIIS